MADKLSTHAITADKIVAETHCGHQDDSERGQVMRSDTLPVRKVTSAGLGGAVATIVLWVLSDLGTQIPALVAGAITTVVCFAVGYLVPGAASDQPD